MILRAVGESMLVRLMRMDRPTVRDPDWRSAAASPPDEAPARPVSRPEAPCGSVPSIGRR